MDRAGPGYGCLSVKAALGQGRHAHARTPRGAPGLSRQGREGGRSHALELTVVGHKERSAIELAAAVDKFGIVLFESNAFLS